METEHQFLGRGEAELLVPGPARHCVCHYEAVLKDVSAGRTSEEHEESGSVPGCEGHELGVCFEWQAHPSALHAVADADWAGDRQSRKSVSGCMILHGKHLIKAWTKHQNIVTTSTAEAELYAVNRAATESMGVQAFAKDLGRVVTIRLHIDSSAALSFISRTGFGKAQHIEIQHLWLQEAVRSGKLTVEKIPTETNSSDLGTKHLTSERSEMLLRLVNCFYV